MNRTRPANSPIRFVQITDFHLLASPQQRMMGIDTEHSFLVALDHAWRQCADAEFFLLTGDLVQDASHSTYQRLRSHLELLPVPCYCLPGNHDAPALMQQVLVGGNISYPTQIPLDGWQILCLDSTIPHDPCGHLAADQLDRLEAQLSAQPQLHTLVALHHSPLPTGAAWLDTMRLDNHADFFALIERFPSIKAVVYGHIHQAMAVTRNGVQYLGCPSSCFQFKPDSVDFALDYVPQGYRWFELYADGSLKTGVVRMEEVPAGLDMASGGY